MFVSPNPPNNAMLFYMHTKVEFSYPPLMPDNENAADCPTGWKYLPTLALPDGSHNFVDDSVFFNLPSLVDPNESVYGVSCYRQIPVEVFIFEHLKDLN